MVDKADIIENKPTNQQLIQVAAGETVLADTENQNNLLLINALILVYNWIIDSGVELSDENSFATLQTFLNGIKTNLISSLASGQDIVLTNGVGAVYKESVSPGNKYLTQTETTVLINSGSGAVDMVGANGVSAGIHGLVPQPAATDNVKFLRGDATFVAINDMVGANGSTPGTHGLVPAPAATGNVKFLRGDGTFVAVREDYRHIFNARMGIDNSLGSTTIKLYPQTNSQVIFLYTNNFWTPYNLTSDLSLTIPGTNNTNYDLYVKDLSGTLTLSSVAWANDTARTAGQEPVLQNGIHVLNGDPTKRFAGSFRTGAVAGTTYNANAQGFIWSMYNPTNPTRAGVTIPTATWTYNSLTYRPPNGNTTAGETRYEFLNGDPNTSLGTSFVERITVRSYTQVFRGTAGFGTATTAIGLDTTSSPVSFGMTIATQNVAVVPIISTTFYSPTVGYHYIQQLENCEAGVNHTFYGSSGSTYMIIERFRGTVNS